MHLIISILLRRQKYRQKRKTMRQNDTKTKQEIVYKSVFINLKIKKIMQMFAFSSSYLYEPAPIH